MNNEINERLNEIVDIMSESINLIDSIWESDQDYVQCSSRVIKEYSVCLGRISGKITAMKIDAKRGLL